MIGRPYYQGAVVLEQLELDLLREPVVAMIIGFAIGRKVSTITGKTSKVLTLGLRSNHVVRKH